MEILKFNKMRELTEKEMRNIEGGWIDRFASAVAWLIYNTLDDIEGSMSSLANGAKNAPLSK